MNKKQKNMLYCIIVAILCIIGLELLPIGGTIKFVLYMVPYFIVGYDILKNKSKENDKKYLKIIEEKNKKIKELERELSTYKSKQVDMFEV